MRATCDKFPEKARFASERETNRVARRQGRQHAITLTPYACNYCFGWHLTSQGDTDA